MRSDTASTRPGRRGSPPRQLRAPSVAGALVVQCAAVPAPRRQGVRRRAASAVPGHLNSLPCLQTDSTVVTPRSSALMDQHAAPKEPTPASHNFRCNIESADCSVCCSRPGRRSTMRWRRPVSDSGSTSWERCPAHRYRSPFAAPSSTFRRRDYPSSHWNSRSMSGVGALYIKVRMTPRLHAATYGASRCFDVAIPMRRGASRQAGVDLASITDQPMILVQSIGRLAWHR